MKKIIFSFAVLSFLIQFPVFAAEMKTEETPGTFMNPPAEIPTPATGNAVNLSQLRMVATNDGGVIVFVGFRLMKYDADLNLVKEVRIQFPKFSASDKPTPAAKKADRPIIPKI